MVHNRDVNVIQVDSFLHRDIRGSVCSELKLKGNDPVHGHMLLQVTKHTVLCIIIL